MQFVDIVNMRPNFATSLHEAIIKIRTFCTRYSSFTEKVLHDPSTLTFTDKMQIQTNKYKFQIIYLKYFFLSYVL